MISQFEQYEIHNPKVIYGGGDDAGAPPDNFID